MNERQYERSSHFCEKTSNKEIVQTVARRLNTKSRGFHIINILKMSR